LNGLFQTGSKRLGHIGIALVTEHHIKDLFITLAAQCSEENDHWNISSNFWNGRIYFTAFFSFLDVQLELQSRFVVFLILGPYLGIPAVLARG